MTHQEIISEVKSNIRMGTNWVTEEYLIMSYCEVAGREPVASQYLELKNACLEIGIEILSEIQDAAEIEELGGNLYDGNTSS